MLQRGKHLVAGDRGFATGGGLTARLFAGGFHALLDRIDRALDHGRIDATLPDGSFRTLGGRGEGPVSIMHLRSWRSLVRVVVSGSVGWYVAWARGEWASPDPVQIFDLFMRNAAGLGDTARAKGPWKAVNWLAHRLRANDRVRARRNIAHHYDLGNDFYAAWLDPGMTYSSAIFAEPGDELETAQAHKVALLLDRLDLAPGQHLLEIGCGWGGLAEIAARDHGVHVTALTLSAEQKAYADGRLAHAGLAGRVDVALTDYRDVEGRFDAIASVEMVEAVGREYWPRYLESIARMLKPGGKAALQLIAIRDDLFDLYAANADFIQTYIFPGGLLIGEARFRALAQDAGLEWRDRVGYGAHYAETLKRWRARYDEAVAEGRLPAGFDDAFHKLWRYYLMYCEGGFRGGGIDVAQVTLVKT
ncbi:MAG TPA: cyclopropane-fatty-acyl-phospholipid synthase family protein [Allosphingosinicella sp.]|jgi:cyclopropane-fatty-acyl-phospholipid synthase|nr:cyclopropane-fatty-acyl-phospholipid synthase family protein [Allosphingosinicella sp.]